MKYIIFDDDSFCIFSDTLVHRDVARASGYTVHCAGAGFCSIEAGFGTKESEHSIVRVSCYGESVTLGIASRGTVDSEIISKKINNDY